MISNATPKLNKQNFAQAQCHVPPSKQKNSPPAHCEGVKVGTLCWPRLSKTVVETLKCHFPSEEKKARPVMPGPGTGGGKNLERGMGLNEIRIMYKAHRRNESSKPWRSRYTPRWKRFLTDGPLKTWESTRVDRLTAISQLAHERAGLSAPHTLPSSQRDLVNMRVFLKPKSRLEEDLSPSRATATTLNAAPDAQNSYTQANHNSGGGRTEEMRDRVNQQQTDRSRISNRTRARGTEIAAGTTSADGWTTFLAKRQVAAIEMRVGQNGGPLPSEAITSFDEPIVYFVHVPARQRATTVADVLRRTGQRKERGFKNRRTPRAFCATKRRLLRTRVTITGIFCNKARFTPDECHNSGRFLQQLLRKGARRRRRTRCGAVQRGAAAGTSSAQGGRSQTRPGLTLSSRKVRGGRGSGGGGGGRGDAAG